MNRKIILLSTASSSLLSLLAMANVAQANPAPSSFQGIKSNGETAILNPANQAENPIIRHINCSCPACTQSANPSLDR